MVASPALLNLVVLRSSDIHRAAGFYRTFGLEFTLHRHGNGPEHYSTELDGLVFEIYPASPKAGPSTGTRIGFLVEAVEVLIPNLVAEGAQIVTAPTGSEWGRRAVVKDPDGHSIELLSKAAKRSADAPSPPK